MMTCAMPGCRDLILRGSRLCAKHASAGNDLRVPQYALNIGLDKIYSAMEQWDGLFSVEAIIDKVDPNFGDCDTKEKVNRTNAMAKLFRTLRANNFLTKSGYHNGFVCYSKNVWNRGVAVSVEEEGEEAGALRKTNTPVSVDKPSMAANIVPAGDHARLVQQLGAQLAVMEKLQSSVDLLWQKAKQLDEAILKIMHRLDSAPGGSCPVAQLRSDMHVLLGGKKGG